MTSEGTARAVADIVAERNRQRSREGWTEEHDDEHREGELAKAAACYAWAATLASDVRRVMASGSWSEAVILRRLWPWGRSWWKPKSPREDLVKAAALIVAEIERIDRMAEKAERLPHAS